MQEPGGNYILSGIGPGRATITGEWTNVYLNCRINIQDGALLVAYQERTGTSRYTVRLEETGLVLSREAETMVQLGNSSRAILRGEWLDFEMASEGGHIQIYLNGELQLDVTDPNPLPGGSIGFEGPSAGEVWLDDVAVNELAAAPSEPPPTPTIVESNPSPTPEPGRPKRLCGSALFLPILALGTVLSTLRFTR
jgi:hypothetical protein